MSASDALPRLVSVAEYGISTHDHPLVAMTDCVAAAIQRAGLATKEHVEAALATSAALAKQRPGVGSYHVLVTVICLSGSWQELQLIYEVDAGGYVATWSR